MLPVVVAVGIFALAVAALWPKKASAEPKRDKELLAPGVSTSSDTQKIVAEEVKKTKEAGAPLPAIPYPGSPDTGPDGHVIRVKPQVVTKKVAAKVAAKVANPASLTMEEKQNFIDQSRPLVEDGRASKETVDLYNKYLAELRV